MKTVLAITGAVAISLVALVRGPEALASLRAAYPEDPAQALALTSCAAASPGFVRLSENDRAGCYQRFQALRPVKVEAPNFVDLRAAAGRGRQPKNDIVTQQQNAQYLAARAQQGR